MDDWRAFAERFVDSDDADEQKLRDLITDEVIPTIEEEQARRRAELAEQERKRLTRAQTRESQAEEENRLAAERIAAAERGTRSARHVKSYAEAAPTLETEAASKAPASGESREERLRKREEEKRRHEEELERQQLEELREREREEARQKNGGVLPVELMTDEERAAHELALEQERKRADEERKRAEAEEKKKQREEAKVRFNVRLRLFVPSRLTLLSPAACSGSRTSRRTKSGGRCRKGSCRRGPATSRTRRRDRRRRRGVVPRLRDLRTRRMELRALRSASRFTWNRTLTRARENRTTAKG